MACGGVERPVGAESQDCASGWYVADGPRAMDGRISSPHLRAALELGGVSGPFDDLYECRIMMQLCWPLSMTAVMATARVQYPVCNATINQANASGVFPFAVDYPTAQNLSEGAMIQNVPDPSWAFTVSSADGSTEKTLWYDTAGQNYSNDLALEYDVCTFVVSGLTKNTLELGQDDPGDCTSTFSTDCSNAILIRLADSAHKWTQYFSPPPFSNLSAGVLPSICNYIALDRTEDGKAFPRACAKEFGFSYDPNNPTKYNKVAGMTSIPLTGYNSTVLDEVPCTLHGNGRSFRPVIRFVSTDADAYDEFTRDVMPVLTAFFPLANYKRISVTSWANSTMRCLRAKNFSQSSRVSALLPKGTPYSYGSGFSGGAIAGIVVGVVVFVAIIAAVAYGFWRRRRRQRSQPAKLAEAKEDEHKELGGTDVHELKPEDRKHETDSHPVYEVGAVPAAAELPEEASRAELSG